MTERAPPTCWAGSAMVKSCSPIAPTTATPCAPTSPRAALGPTSSQCPAASTFPRSAAYLYRFRNLVERFFNKLKHFRAVATRFEKHDANYLALVKLAAARIWMRFMSR